MSPKGRVTVGTESTRLITCGPKIGVKDAAGQGGRRSSVMTGSADAPEPDAAEVADPDNGRTGDSDDAVEPGAAQPVSNAIAMMLAPR
jgi:hypothetical protein